MTRTVSATNVCALAAHSQKTYNELFDSERTELGWSMQLAFSVAVFGYWSDHTITVYLRRESQRAEDGTPQLGIWTATISQSSGGRDGTEVAHDADAVLNFAEGLRFASTFARSLEARSAEIEAVRQTVIDREKAAAEAALAADPTFSARDAQLLLDELKLGARRHGNAVVRVWPAGTPADKRTPAQAYTIAAVRSIRDPNRVSFRYNNISYTSAELLRKLQSGLSAQYERV